MARPAMGNWRMLSMSGLSGLPEVFKSAVAKTLELLPPIEDAYSRFFACSNRKQHRSTQLARANGLTPRDLEEEERAAKRPKSHVESGPSAEGQKGLELDLENPLLSGQPQSQWLCEEVTNNAPMMGPSPSDPPSRCEDKHDVLNGVTQVQGPRVNVEDAGREPIIGLYSYQNVRPYQEDRASTLAKHGVTYMAINDGHAGASTATFLQVFSDLGKNLRDVQRLLKDISDSLQDTGLSGPGIQISRKLCCVYQSLNMEISSKPYTCGSTATTVMMDGRRLVSANCGDSPSFVLTKSRDIYLMSEDHSPSCANERHRIEQAGGRIATLPWGGNMDRVVSHDSLAGLAMTRAFGDQKFPGVICDPYVCIMEDMSDAHYIVLASDGLTESWSIEGAATYLWELADAGHSCALIAQKLTDRAVQLGSRDNVTVIVVDVSQYTNSIESADEDGCTVQLRLAPGRREQASLDITTPEKKGMELLLPNCRLTPSLDSASSEIPEESPRSRAIPAVVC